MGLEDELLRRERQLADDAARAEAGARAVTDRVATEVPALLGLYSEFVDLARKRGVPRVTLPRCRYAIRGRYKTPCAKPLLGRESGWLAPVPAIRHSDGGDWDTWIRGFELSSSMLLDGDGRTCVTVGAIRGRRWRPVNTGLPAAVRSAVVNGPTLADMLTEVSTASARLGVTVAEVYTQLSAGLAGSLTTPRS